MISKAINKMIFLSDGNNHDINHFLKVWAYAKIIGEQEGLGEYEQQVLELAAIVHDIACPLCREKYGNTNGAYQEQEGMPMAKAFCEDIGEPENQREKICFLVGNHHTYSNVDSLEHQILLEADFLVNADESKLSYQAIINFREKVFKTKTGIMLLNSVYQLG